MSRLCRAPRASSSEIEYRVTYCDTAPRLIAVSTATEAIGEILDRKMADKRIFPAIDIKRSGTRKEDLLIKKDALNRIWILRKLLNTMNPADCMDFLCDKLNHQKSNADFLDSMNG